jgi:hypothetical protein
MKNITGLYIYFSSLLLFETRSPYVAQAGLELIAQASLKLMICLPLPLEC